MLGLKAPFDNTESAVASLIILAMSASIATGVLPLAKALFSALSLLGRQACNRLCSC